MSTDEKDHFTFSFTAPSELKDDELIYWFEDCERQTRDILTQLGVTKYELLPGDADTEDGKSVYDVGFAVARDKQGSHKLSDQWMEEFNKTHNDVMVWKEDE